LAISGTNTIEPLMNHRPESSVGPSCRHCKDGREKFLYLDEMYVFDVDRARAIVGDGREPVELDDESVQHSVDIVTIYEEHLEHVDVAYPGIVAHLQYFTEEGELLKGHVLIDGHHRAARCLQINRPFWAHLLTEEESRAVLLAWPGSGAAEPVEPIAGSRDS